MIQAPSTNPPLRRSPSTARVLIVDDDEAILAALRRQLRAGYRTVAVSRALEALDVAAEAAGSDEGAFAVVVSDLKMPGMDGLAFLAEMRERSPDTVRLLLTGFADLDTAIDAVNSGNVFRFLCKPCPSPVIVAAVDAAAEQHRLVTSERELLQQTLNGSIDALLETLALANPPAFSRAVRIRGLVTELLDELGVDHRWHIEVASMLSQLGAVTLPAALVEKLHSGGALDSDEQALVSELPRLAVRLVADIPRLDEVREIISALADDQVASRHQPLGTRIVRVALAYDAQEAAGRTVGEIVESLRSQVPLLDDSLVETMCGLKGSGAPTLASAEVSVGELRSGMILAADLTTLDGVLLVGRGQPVSENLLARIRNFGDRVDRAATVPVTVTDATAR